MAWWGKIIGGALGFVIGGPLGAMLGATFGHRFDERADSGGGGFLPGNQERVQAAFFTATFSVMGHVAKADGHVSKHEIQLAQQLMDHMQLSGAQRKAAISLFDQGKQAGFDLDAVLEQFRVECHRRTTLLRMFLEMQVQAAFADGKFDPDESRVLKRIAAALHFSEYDLEQLIDLVRGASASHTHKGGPTLEEAYQILGVNADTPYSEIKKTYRKLISQHHPDKLVSKGLPEEMIKLANEKTGEIRAAWELIQESRSNA